MTTHILVTIDLDENLVGALKKISEDLEITISPARQSAEIQEEDWGKTEVLFTRSVLPEPEQAPNLRWIQSNSANIDLILQSPIANNPDIVITSISGANALQTAEYTLMMMLSLGHQLPDLFAAQNRSAWLTNKNEVYKPLELSESIVGIVGYGSVGRQVARLLHNFGAQILATKRDIKDPTHHGYTPKNTGDPKGDYFTRLYPPEAINTMLKECDYVIVTTPLTPSTQSLINMDQFNAMKPSAYLIDVSTGGVVDHENMLNALVQHKIAGAGLDVFPLEPLPADSLLWQMPNVIITPHLAGNSTHSTDRAVALFSENLSRYLNNEPLLNQIDLDLGY